MTKSCRFDPLPAVTTPTKAGHPAPLLPLRDHSTLDRVPNTHSVFHPSTTLMALVIESPLPDTAVSDGRSARHSAPRHSIVAVLHITESSPPDFTAFDGLPAPPFQPSLPVMWVAPMTEPQLAQLSALARRRYILTRPPPCSALFLPPLQGIQRVFILRLTLMFNAPLRQLVLIPGPQPLPLPLRTQSTRRQLRRLVPPQA